jgi:hypothetical protein
MRDVSHRPNVREKSVDNCSATMLPSLPEFSCCTSLYCIAHACLYWGRVSLSPEVIRLVIRKLVSVDEESPWWALVPVPRIAMENTSCFNIWCCFLGWEAGEGVIVTLEGGICAGPVHRRKIYSARQMLEWGRKVNSYAERQRLAWEKENSKLTFEKEFKCDYGMEVVVGEEGQWKEPLDCAWRAIGAFMRTPNKWHLTKALQHPPESKVDPSDKANEHGDLSPQGSLCLVRGNEFPP